MTLEQQLLSTVQDELAKICVEYNINLEDIKIESLPGIINIILPGAIHKVEIEGHIDFNDAEKP